jgi:hypothetical protein
VFWDVAERDFRIRSAVKTLNTAWPHPRDRGEENFEAEREKGTE